MKGHAQGKHLTACHECDLLINLKGHLSVDGAILCPRCKHEINKSYRNPLDKVLALSITAILTLVFANSFPFLSFEAKGQSHSITLLQTSLELFAQGYPILSLLVLAFIVVLPMVYLLCVITLALPIKLGVNRPPPITLGRIIDALLPWAMADVFIVGVLVALIKMVSMAHIIFGISFWSYILFTVLFLIVANIMNSHRLWHWVEHGE